MPNDRFMALKFIANIFQFSLEEIKETLGPEALTMIMRRVGESVGEKISIRLKGKYTTVEQFCGLLAKDVIEPVIGTDKVKVVVEGDDIKFILDSCPYKKAGFPIQSMDFFCHYTEGLLDNSLKKAFPDMKISVETTGELISKPGCAQCVFKIIS